MDGSEIPELVRLERIAAENKQQNAELIEAMGKLGPMNHGTVTTSGVHIHSDGIVAMIVGLIGIALAGFAAFCLMVAVAAVLIVSAWRDADMNDLIRVRGDVRELQAYKSQHSDRINKLEAKTSDESTEGR